MFANRETIPVFEAFRKSRLFGRNKRVSYNLPPSLTTPDNIAAAAESVREAPKTSFHRRSQQLNISETSLRRILHKDLGMTPYKVQLVQQLKPNDHPMRFRFAKWACDRLREDADFAKKNHLFR